MWNMVGSNKMLLETWLYRRLDLLDLTDDALDLAPRGPVQERNPRPGASGVARRGHLVQRAIGDHAEDHRVFGRDMGAEGPCEHDPFHLRDPAGRWQLAWPMLNIAQWGDRWFC